MQARSIPATSHEPSLAADIATMLGMTASRRQSLRWLFAGAAALPLAGCGADVGAVDGETVVNASGGACSLIPEETGGPYPGDGTNTSVNGVANALILAGIVRSDIRASVAGASGVAAGVPLTIRLQLVDVNAGCAALAGAAFYLWHFDRDGNYSMYSSALAKENYLRGVQEADSGGVVTFNTIFPGCYAGRMPHVHFEVYPSLPRATLASNRIRTSQFGFPGATLAEAYSASGYATSVRNLAGMRYATDNVFSDGTGLQIASMNGSAALGYTATLTVGVAL
jgi:protocatechuate 3,4-dioxygenase beta subunit